MSIVVEGILIGVGVFAGVMAVNCALIACATCISTTAKYVA